MSPEDIKVEATSSEKQISTELHQIGCEEKNNFYYFYFVLMYGKLAQVGYWLFIEILFTMIVVYSYMNNEYEL